MSVFAMNNAYVALASTDLSAYAKSLELVVETDVLDATAFQSNAFKASIAGMKGGTLNITFNADVAAAALDSIMWPLVGTIVTFEVRAVNATVSSSNPKYTGSCVISGWNPIAGSVGEIAENSVSLPTTGTITRSESP